MGWLSKPSRKQGVAYGVAAYLLLHALMPHVLPWAARLLRGAGDAQPPPPQPPLQPSLYHVMAELVEPHGYPLQEHFATTSDGWILRLFRVPHGRHSTAGAAANATCAARRPVVFLQHALMDSSAGWLLLGRSSLALQLADAGFDVWLGNSRGNRFSRNHSSLHPDRNHSAFWAWSWDELAAHDLPASINTALAVSGQARAVLVGYSQGTMMGLAALSSQPALAARVSLALLLAPVAFTAGMTSPVFVWPARLRLDEVGISQGWGEWGSFVQANADLLQPVCRRAPWLCLLYLTSFCGTNPRGNIDHALLPHVFQHLPAGTSIRNMAHWAQGIRRGHSSLLHRFDYGSVCSSSSSSSSSSSNASGSSAGGGGGHVQPSCNQQAYGQASPPAYDMARITTPLALFTGGHDTISTSADVERLKRRLLPGVLVAHFHAREYAHLDYQLGTDVPTRAYPRMLRLAAQFSRSSS